MQYTGKDNAITYTLTGVIFSVIYCISVFITWLTTWEAKDIQPEQDIAQHPARKGGFTAHFKYLFLDLASSFRIKAFRQHLLIYLFSFTAIDAFVAVFTYFVIYGLKQDASLASLLLSNMMFMSIPGTFIFMMLLGRFNMTPSNALRIAYLGIMAVFIFLFAIYQWQWQVPTLAFSAVFLFLGIMRAGLIYIPWNIYSFIPDIDEMVTCKRREGIFAGVMVLTRKSSVAVAIFMIGVVLQESGFVKGNGSQPESAVQAIVGLMVFVTAGLLAVSFWLTFRFKLTQRSHKLLVKEVARRKLGGTPAQCDEATRAVIKELTGYAYDEVWGTARTKTSSDTAISRELKSKL